MKPGSKVICVNDQFEEEAQQRLSVFPKKGVCYTVKEIIPDPLGQSPAGIVLEGLSNPIGWVPSRNGFVQVEYSFRASRFVPESTKEEIWAGAEIHLDHFKTLKSIQN
ncbi:MAG TPA: hypothetical protein VLA58_08075 [Chitinophagaceae bacterium]|nr:hypothetical protein [Chitinophagaceae bacterium]